MGDNEKTTMMDKIGNAMDKWLTFADDHPVLYYGGCFATGFAIGLIYQVGRISGAKTATEGMLVITRAACDDEAYGRIVKVLSNTK